MGRWKRRGDIALCIATMLVMLVFVGCSKSKKEEETWNGVLTATIENWNEFGGDDAEPQELEGLKKGDVIYDGMGYKLTVKKITEDEIVLKSTGGIIETEKGGGINLNKIAPSKLVIENGEEKYFATQSMDAGVSFTFHYEVRTE